MRRAAALLLLSLATPLLAQQSDDVFSDVIDVRVVNFETVVEDAQGRRVSGLTRDDFRLIVDGRELPVEYFSEVRDGFLLPESTPVTDTPSESPLAEASPERRNTHFLVFVDDVFSIGAQRNLVLDKVAQQLTELHTDDRVAVVSFDGGDVERLSDWTSAPAEIRAALERAKKRKAKGAFRRMERAVINPAFSRQESYIRLVEEQLENLTVAASIAMRSAAPETGRKVLLLLSGGWPYELNIYADPTLRTTFGDSDSLNQRFMAQREQFGRNLWSYSLGTGIFQTLADTANLLGYTIYPIDVPGIGGSGDIASDGPAPAQGLLAEAASESGVEASLLFLARETGGKAMLNSNRLTALERTAEDTRSYYWLGFTSDRRANNQRHRVQIEARRPDLKVRTRKDYVDFSRQVEVEMMVEGALLFQADEDGDDFDVRLGDPTQIARKKMEIPIQLAIPTDELTHLYYGGEYLARMTVTLAVKDRRNTLSSVVTLPFEARRSDRPATGDVTTYDVDVELWRERHDLVVMVQDLATGTVLTSSVEVRPN